MTPILLQGRTKMAKGNLTTEQIKKNSIHSMLESLIAGKSDEAGEMIMMMMMI